ncbi:MAG: hypothetical protein AAGD38_15855 [Acidobacteriota bacterium]
MSRLGSFELDQEARIFGEYVLGVEPSPALIERYRDAHHHLDLKPTSPDDIAVLAVVRERPWTVAPLDAALAWVRPRATLRAKLITMAAIQETTPELIEHFDRSPRGRVRLFGELATIGTRAAIDIVVGVVLLMTVVRRQKQVRRR